jgi:DNA processing protein
MDDRERLAWLGLCWGAEFGPAGFARLLLAYGSALEALRADEADLTLGEARVKPAQAEAMRRVKHTLEAFGREADEVRRSGAQVLFSLDPDYPAVLQELPHPPPVICLKGRLLPADALAVAIVGTRSPSHEGAELATRLATAAAADEFTVVSGLARGVDTAAHQGALAHEGRTIAIIGSGINKVTPSENANLAEGAIASGALISELPPMAEATIPNLMARNRLISLFSRGAIVVECRATGGSMSTAQSALQQGRKLYAVQWPQNTEYNEGNAQLLVSGAEPIYGVHDMRRVGLQLRAWQHWAEDDEEEPQEKAQLSLF